MAPVTSSSSSSFRSGRTAAVAATTDLQISNKRNNNDREISPQRTQIWTQPPQNKLKSQKKVPVVYYLSRNGQLEHPHFIQVPLSSPEGLYLRDVINRLDFLRGKGMASLYSWSSKRSYRNGFVWHDLAENDFIYPAHGQEYVLKGSELVVTPLPSISDETVASICKQTAPESVNSGEESYFPAVVRRRNQSWSAIDLHEYKVYKTESRTESAGRAAADASTQTDDKSRRRRAIRQVEIEEEECVEEGKAKESHQNQTTELCGDEISPPPSDSSPETLESLMKADGGLVHRQPGINQDRTANNNRAKASSVLMQLISCGSMSFRICGPGGYGKDLISHYKARMPRGVEGANQVGKDVGKGIVGTRVKLEDKEYFSGSLIQTKKDEFPALKRSNSYNADR